MADKPLRAMLIGADSMMLRFLDRFVAEGSCPTLAHLVKHGASGLAYPSHPTFTPTNWTTIATGCDTDVHKVAHWVFDARASKAEHLWNAAARAGRASILVRYTTGWPSTHPLVTTVEVGKPNTSPWMLAPPTWYSTAPPEVVSTGLHGRFESERISFAPPQGWTNLPPDAKLAATVSVAPLAGQPAPQLHLLALGSSLSRCDRLLVCASPDASKHLCQIVAGHWSDYIRLPMPPEQAEGAFRLKLVRMSPDLSDFSLYRTMVYQTGGFSEPPGVAEDLVKRFGPRLDNTPRLPLAMGWYDTYFEELDQHLRWLADASTHLLAHNDWTLFFTQAHTADYVAHEKMAAIDPAGPGHDPDRAEEAWQVWRRCYRALDRWVAHLLRAADDRTLVLFVSDHGHVALQKHALLGNALAEAGLISLTPDGEFDPAASKLQPAEHLGYQVRTRSRFKDGSVSSDDFESVREQALQVLRSVRDPDNGRFPVEIALRGEESAFLGLSREQADIIVLVGAGYGAALSPASGSQAGQHFRGPDPAIGSWGGAQGTHGIQPAWASLSLGTISAAFALSGPGIRENLRLNRPIYLRDLAPTLAHLLDLPTPADATGRVLRPLLLD